MAGGDGHIYWLVEGKAFKVACEDEFAGWWEEGQFFADAEGGIYAVGDQHLWYMKTGKAIQVKQAVESEAPPEARAVTERTLMWSALAAYGKAVYRAGQDAGYQSGFEAAYEEYERE